MSRPPRRLVAVHGGAAQTRDLAAEPLRGQHVLWVSEHPHPSFDSVRPKALRAQLGTSWDAVVLDLHDGLDADLLAAAHGFIHSGGTLVLRLSKHPVSPGSLLLPPHASAGTRLEHRIRARLPPHAPPSVPVPATQGTAEQAALVDTLASSLHGPPSLHALVAPRGRGKSTALGLALARRPAIRAVVCGPNRSALAQLFTHINQPYTHPNDPIDLDADLIVVDEAAQLPVPWLRDLVDRHPSAHLWFATTTGGYEGTGQGFSLRFLDYLRDNPRPLHHHSLHQPIRWAQDDPLEAWTQAALLLDSAPALAQPSSDEPVACHVTQDELAADDGLLRDVFGLLRRAHYRTAPSDLHRVLDSPNLDTHLLRWGDRVVAVNLVAREGGLPNLARAIYEGSTRVRGHALPDTLSSHCGIADAPALSWVRSVRIATHPDFRGRGLARQLVDHVHRSYQPDGFGTLFGLSSDVLRFRDRMDYRLVRLGTSRGSRTGEPSAVMVRPCSERARRIVETLQPRLARDLTAHLRFIGGPWEPGLATALHAHLPPPSTLTPDEQKEAVHAYCHGPRPLEAAATAVLAWLQSIDRSAWSPTEEALLQGRLVDQRPWNELAHDLQLAHARVAMRVLKRAIRAAYVANG